MVYGLYFAWLRAMFDPMTDAGRSSQHFCTIESLHQ
jgi:hypothetical protein